MPRRGRRPERGYSQIADMGRDAAGQSEGTRVLITDAETRAVVAAARGLRAGGFTVVAAAAESARPAPAHWSRSVAKRLVVPHALEDESGFINALERALTSFSCAVLMPGSDASLVALSAARQHLAPYVPLRLPRHEIVERCLEKLVLASAASHHGLASPPTAVCSTTGEGLSAARGLGLPVVVKPMCPIVELGGTRRHVGCMRVGDEASR